MMPLLKSLTFLSSNEISQSLTSRGLELIAYTIGATMFPEFMDVCVPFCGSAKTSLHNQVFLEGVKAALIAPKLTSSAGSCADIALTSDEKFRTWGEQEKEVGLRAFARVYAGWGFSQAFYREKLYETALGFKSLEDFMVGFWESWALSKGMCGVSYSSLTFHLDLCATMLHVVSIATHNETLICPR